MRSIETGGGVPFATRPLNTPIYQNSVFEIERLERVDDIYEGRVDGSCDIEWIDDLVADIEQALTSA